MAKQQVQSQPPDKGRARKIAADSRFFSRAFSGLKAPGKGAKKAGHGK